MTAPLEGRDFFNVTVLSAMPRAFSFRSLIAPSLLTPALRHTTETLHLPRVFERIRQDVRAFPLDAHSPRILTVAQRST